MSWRIGRWGKWTSSRAFSFVVCGKRIKNDVTISMNGIHVYGATEGETTQNCQTI